MNATVQNNNKGVKYLIEKNFENAESEFREALSKDSKNTTALNNLGLLYHQQKHYKKAVSCFQNAIEIQQKDTYFLNLANSQVFLHNYADAEENYKKCLDINPDNLNAKISIARFYETTGRANLAAPVWENLDKNSPNDYFKLELAKNMMTTGNYENALSLFQILQRKKNSALINCYVGICEFFLNNYGQAEIAFKKSLAIDPDYYEARHYLAVNYLSKGDYDMALKQFDFLIKLYPANIKVKLDKALILIDTGKFSEASEIIKEVLIRDPENKKALHYKNILKESNR